MNFFKLLLILTVFPMISSAQLIKDEKCALRYVDAVEDLINLSTDFNAGKINKLGYTSKINSVSATIATKRLACIGESDEAKKCIAKTKSVYKDVRSKINLSEILTSKDDIKVEVSDLQFLKLFKGIFACPIF